MHAGQGIRADRRSWAGANWPFEGLFKRLMLFAIVCAPPWAVADELKIIVMPMEHPRQECEPFDINSFTARSPTLAIENDSEAEWHELRIGHHCWLCGEVEKLAEKEPERILIRFVSWRHARENLTERYSRECAVLQIPSTWTAALIDKGRLAAYEAVDANDYPPGALESCRGPDGQTYYAVPWHLDFRVLYFRDVLAENPQDLVEFKTFYDRLLERQAYMREHPNGVWRAPMGLGKTRDWDVLHNTLNWTFGGRILDDPDGHWQAVFHQGKPYDGLCRLCQLRQENLVHFFDASDAQDKQEWQVLAEKLSEGMVDAVVGGPYMRVRFADRAEIRAAPLPRIIDGCDHTFLGGSHLGFTATAKDRGKAALAGKVIARLTSFEVEVDLYKNTDAMPVRRDAFERFLDENPRWEAFGRALKSAQPYPSLPQWAEVIEEDTTLGSFHNVVESIARGDKCEKVAPLLDAAAEEINGRLAPHQVIWPYDVAGSLIVVLAAGAILWAWGARRKALEQHAQKERETAILNQLAALASATGDLVKQHGASGGLFIDILTRLGGIDDLVQQILTRQPESADETETLASKLRTEYGSMDDAVESVSQKITADLAEKLEEYQLKMLGAIRAVLGPPSGALKLSQCGCLAEIGYERGQVTLKLAITHQGQPLGTESWKGRKGGRFARLFEMAESQRVAQRHGNAEVQTWFYMLTHGDLPHRGLPDNADTPNRFIRRFREEVRTFFVSECKVEVDVAKDEELLFAHEPAQQGVPASYRFALPDQVDSGRFSSNLESAHTLAQSLLNQGNRCPQDISEPLEESPRAVSLWSLFHQLNNVIQVRADLRSRGREMIHEERARCLRAARTACTPRGWQVIPCWGWSPEKVWRAFRGLAREFKTVEKSIP